MDPRVPLADSVGALRDLQTAGKIAAIGLSNVSIEQIELARAEAPIASVQNRLSLADRADLATVAHCATVGLRYLAYQPLGGSGRHHDDPTVTEVAAIVAIGATPATRRLSLMFPWPAGGDGSGWCRPQQCHLQPNATSRSPWPAGVSTRTASGRW